MGVFQFPKEKFTTCGGYFARVEKKKFPPIIRVCNNQKKDSNNRKIKRSNRHFEYTENLKLQDIIETQPRKRNYAITKTLSSLLSPLVTRVSVSR